MKTIVIVLRFILTELLFTKDSFVRGKMKLSVEPIIRQVYTDSSQSFTSLLFLQTKSTPFLSFIYLYYCIYRYYLNEFCLQKYPLRSVKSCITSSTMKV